MTENFKLNEDLKHLFPYTAMYMELYGVEAMVSTFEIPRKYGSPEGLYKYCIENNKKAREIIFFPPKDAIL